ncbi:Peptidase family M20/M25/M40 superfamily protein [Fictibacillus macauensis ZFHKF-1]|uniref:Cytosol non-specific dipeptidase n=1 Tax=Fictibacillus macauensis ZFHKF-1 TaxID=1196324 RepID=I8AIY1_9BACL|nr:aminoacyl-histidine dipeptidase [Fictibacillus macauensis]EIT85727.1 Peptidase family M20/M25/M40 superfamily protein [Fictibacillus macauensis ZFHKF-1]
MNTSIEELIVHPVFHYFYEISKIPRSSGNEREISNYLVQFATKRNLEVIQDEALNVIIKKPASPGYEHVPAVIIQGHMDMVCEKNKATLHDFSKDHIKWQRKDDFLYATETTLGADNGIAVAYALALLDDDSLAHPALEIVITTEEETSMKGALEVAPQHFSGEIFINLDSEEEGTLLVSSAGGVTAVQTLPVNKQAIPPSSVQITLTVKGLFGGHSGMSIQKGRGNANKIMGRLLYDLDRVTSYSIATISGGLKSNAIPREAAATLVIPAVFEEQLPSFIANWNETLRNEYRSSDAGVTVHCEVEEHTFTTTYDEITTKRIITSLMLTPNGVQSMSQEIEGLVESSTNLGVVAVDEEGVSFISEIRSSVKSLKKRTVAEVEQIAELTSSHFHLEADYPEWPYRKDSVVRTLFRDTYTNLYTTPPKIEAIHAGLECGIFTEKLPHVDAISLGPTMHDVHTPNEHVSISSTLSTWNYFIEALKTMKNYY